MASVLSIGTWSRWWRVSAVLAMLVGLALPFLSRPYAVLAHPLGNFTINRYARIELAEGEVRVRYVLDMAEIPTFQEMDAIDQDKNGVVSDAENAAYARKKQEDLRRNLRLTVNGNAIDLDGATRELTFPPGQAGLNTMRLSILFTGPLPKLTIGQPQDLAFRDDNYPDRLGWREIVLPASQSVTIGQSTAAVQDLSDELRTYPSDRLTSPLNVTQAKAIFSLTGVAPSWAPASPGTTPEVHDRSGDSGFVKLIKEQKLTAGFVAFALLVALGFGALHSLGPGHGKAIVASYLIGSRGTAKHALFLGLTVTVTHTSTVFTLGFLTLFAERFIAPEKVFLWVGVASGLMVVGMGVWLLVARLRAARLPARRASGTHRLVPVLVVADGHGHSHGGHDHDHGHEHEHDRPDTDAMTAATAHTHTQDHETAHDHGGHDHAHGHDHDHVHGPGGHSHLPPDRVTWRSLLALGVSGGLLPCPSALVVMLGAIALGRVGFGMVLIVAFSLGLAGTLTAIGLLFVMARGLSRRFSLEGRLGRTAPIARLAMRMLPVASAVVITFAGLVITWRALAQAGVGI